MKQNLCIGLVYFAIAALITETMAFFALPASAGNANGSDGNSGKAKGHIENRGPAIPGANVRLALTMGSLNAVQTSTKGLEHANARSRDDALAAYSTNLDTYNRIMNEISDIDAELAVLAGQIAVLDRNDPEFETRLAELDDKTTTLKRYKGLFQRDADKVSGDLSAAAGDAAESLKGAANKDGPIDATMVDAVNNLLDGK